MIPNGFAGVEAQLWLWMVAMIRPGAAFLAAPVFGANFVPLQLRLIIALAIGIPALGATNFVLPADGLGSIEGLLMVGGEVMAGLALGFAVQIGFSSAMLAGETISNAMGLGFAGMMDPATGQQNPMLGQFLTILATFLFLGVGGHLALAATIVESYRALPPGDAWMSAESIHGLVLFGGVLFAAGLSIALPVGFALILVQLVMGMLARSAPQLNLFSVGLPATLLAGIVLLAMAAPVMGDAIVGVVRQGLEESRRIATGG
ncbi:flagellar biosynthetic protein FliR [Allosphingosinicella deserti]|uniref:Flagellar biosynthetic protein FliR n=1 Tax=Allosphingosinicella deserti TaxID=2116704 RepID=A0A2P7QNY0_9SPHN|nr:flagellar biosynthetic protein FliR [Sphingomonas deserti]PSJ39683.1 flagellar biosynthetic protein FliR [Sphingomonas deserti]